MFKLERNLQSGIDRPFTVVFIADLLVIQSFMLYLSKTATNVPAMVMHDI